jgi:hypothetical protein
MSVFSGENNQNTEETQVQESFVKKLVETKGEKWSDPEVIAKGKVEADAYIEALKREIEQLKTLATQNNKVDELIAKIEQKAAQPISATQSGQGRTEETNTKSGISENEIQSLVEKALTERERNQSAKQNIAEVDSRLNEMYGTEAVKVVQGKAKELGLSLARLQEIASESPSAFLQLIGEKPSDFKPMVSGTIRTEAVTAQTPGTRNNAWYQKLRKENPSLFHKSQQQMLQDRQRLGDKFYS